MKRWLVEEYDSVRALVVARGVVEAKTWEDARRLYVHGLPVSPETRGAMLFSPALRCTEVTALNAPH